MADIAAGSLVGAAMREVAVDLVAAEVTSVAVGAADIADFTPQKGPSAWQMGLFTYPPEQSTPYLDLFLEWSRFFLWQR
jgi:hypothetical protein